MACLLFYTITILTFQTLMTIVICDEIDKVKELLKKEETE